MLVSQVSVASGSTDECEAFISSPALLQAARARGNGVLRYFEALGELLRLEKKSFSAVETKYTFDDEDATCVVLYDVKCSAHFEDPEVERIYSAWEKDEALKREFGPICPFRRGMGFGLANNNTLLLCIGNAKFFYADSENEILEHDGQVILSEKANGEYTMLSSSNNGNGKDFYWLIFGSKNVRLALPYFPGSAGRETIAALNSLVQLYLSADGVSMANSRFSFLTEMVPLWLDLVQRRWETWQSILDSGVTILGEQVGVHKHIFDGYASAHIRIFAILPHEQLTTSAGCDLKQVQTLLQTTAANSQCQTVRFTTFDLPKQREECRAALWDIASGSMHVHGEGVVVYLYRECNSGEGETAHVLKRMIKYKCEEYAFDRRLRTLLSKLAADLSSSSRVVDWSKLRAASERITSELEGALAKQFSKMNATRARERIALVPAIIAFLERHQRTLYCADFSDQFVSLLNAVEQRAEEYMALAQQGFATVAGDADELLLMAWDHFLQQHCDEAAGHVEVKPVLELAQYIAEEWKKRGGKARFPLIGIASPPGGGKTSILRAVEQIIPGAKLCDRDAYCIAASSNGSGGDGEANAHQAWMADIKRYMEDDECAVVLVGNTFAGTFASKLEKELRASAGASGASKLLLFAIQETLKLDNWFHLLCLQRLRQRTSACADGSTLTMHAGSAVILNKYFNSAPNEGMLGGRLKQGSAVTFSVLVPQTNNATSEEFLQDLRELATMATTTTTTKAGAERAPFARYVKSTTRPTHGNKRLVFIGINPEEETCKRYLEMGDADLLRTDCHLTLAYLPSLEEQDALVAASLPPVLHGLQLITIALAPPATAALGAKLQFVRMDSEQGVLDAICSEHAPHVTIGTTDYSLLPPASSGKALSLLAPLLKHNMPALPLQLENGWWVLAIKELDSRQAEFVGELCFYSS